MFKGYAQEEIPRLPLATITFAANTKHDLLGETKQTFCDLFLAKITDMIVDPWL